LLVTAGGEAVLKLSSLVILGLLFATIAARAETVTYQIDSKQSYLQMTGSYRGEPLKFSFPSHSAVMLVSETPDMRFDIVSDGNSATAANWDQLEGFNAYTGTITGDRDHTSNTVQLTGADARPYQSSFNPHAQPGAHAFSRPFQSIPGWSFDGTFQNLSFGFITSPAGDLQLVLNSGQMDYAQTIMSGTVPASSTTTTGSFPLGSPITLQPPVVSIHADGITEILTIPIEADFFLDVTGTPLASGQPPTILAFHLSGVFVATSSLSGDGFVPSVTTPEPSALALTLPALCLLLRRRRVSFVAATPRGCA
jgi:hypothetical protein